MIRLNRSRRAIGFTRNHTDDGLWIMQEGQAMLYACTKKRLIRETANRAESYDASRSAID